MTHPKPQGGAHKCTPVLYCMCYLLADEPDDSCPVHGWPNKLNCINCGRFMKIKSLSDQKDGA